MSKDELCMALPPGRGDPGFVPGPLWGSAHCQLEKDHGDGHFYQAPVSVKHPPRRAAMHWRDTVRETWSQRAGTDRAADFLDHGTDALPRAASDGRVGHSASVCRYETRQVVHPSLVGTACLRSSAIRWACPTRAHCPATGETCEVRFKLFGSTIEVKRLRRAEAAEHDRLLQLREQILSQTPGLQKDGPARYASIGELVDQGWTGEQIARLVGSWPEASAISVSMTVSLAGRMTYDGVDDPDEVIAWIRALLESDGHGLLGPTPLVRAELDDAGRSLPDAVALWTDAAGSRSAGLAALSAGFTLSHTRRKRRPDARG